MGSNIVLEGIVVWFLEGKEIDNDRVRYSVSSAVRVAKGLVTQ